MNGDTIFPPNSIARYCPPSKVEHDPITLEPLAVSLENFKPKISEIGTNKGISVNWLEKHAKPKIKDTINSIRERMESYPYNIKKNGAFAIATVKYIIEAGLRNKSKLSVVENHHKLIDGSVDDSHALIIGIKVDDELLQQEIALNVDIYSI